MLTDIAIAQSIELKNIKDVAKDYRVVEESLEMYGNYKAKVDLDYYRDVKADGKLILVTAISPTPAGEGKTTVNIGLSQGLNRLGKKAVSALREPSLGPSFGMKGGAAGGGYSQVLPMEDINLHFTGDMHAITYANNLIAAMIDNHIQQGNERGIDPRNILWKRALDLNDRALRNIVIGLGGRPNGMPSEDGFEITVASEIMAILCLSRDLEELKENIGDILLGYDFDRKPVFVRDIKAEEAATILLKDAIKPNLVQTTENTLAVIHGGPFANIAHGCNSINATELGLKIADYVVTEAGFGADLGAEKFFDIKCRLNELEPNATVIVATIRALKSHGGVDKKDLTEKNLEALEDGYANLQKHIENMKKYQVPLVVAINKFPSDSQEEIDLLKSLVEKENIDCVLTEVWAKGGEGALELAEKVVDLCERDADLKLLYGDDKTIEEKINIVAKEIYGAGQVDFSTKARRKLRMIEELGFDNFPVCMAKTQYSFSDNPKLLKAPKDFKLSIKDLKINSGSKFIVALTGDIMTMPGLPKVAQAERMKIDKDGKIEGLF